MGYQEDLNKNCGYNIIVLDDCGKLGNICNYTDVGGVVHDPDCKYCNKK